MVVFVFSEIVCKVVFRIILNNMFSIDNYRILIREKLNPYLGHLRLKLGRINPSFTIISNNCWAGHVYRYFNIPYQSPTIGLFFFADDYIKFICNLHYYIDSEIVFISAGESKYADELRRRGHEEFPIGKIDDIEVFFLHYKSVEEARKKWNRRKKRINWDNIYYKFSEQNLCKYEHLLQFDDFNSQNKFVFVSKDYGLKSQVVYYDYLNKGEIPNDTIHFRKYINLVSFIKGRSFIKHQHN